MKNNNTILHSFLHALGVFIYVGIVAWMMVNGERIFGKVNNALGPLMFLMLFVVSALITSSLVLGRPIYLYFEGRKKEGLELFFWTSAWLVLITILIFSVAIIM